MIQTAMMTWMHSQNKSQNCSWIHVAMLVTPPFPLRDKFSTRSLTKRVYRRFCWRSVHRSYPCLCKRIGLPRCRFLTLPKLLSYLGFSTACLCSTRSVWVTCSSDCHVPYYVVVRHVSSRDLLPCSSNRAISISRCLFSESGPESSISCFG